MAKLFQPLFRRGMDLVFVRPFRTSDISFQPGDPVPSEFRTFHRRSLYKRRIVGPAGNAWTEAAVRNFGTGIKPEVNADTPKVDEADDFTEINGIGASTAKKLQEAGVTTFAELAALGEEDPLVKDPSWIAQAEELSED